MKSAILSNLKQLLLIVFSVVLGILLSERIEEGKNEKEAALLLEQIKAEVNDNRKLLAYWVPYHGSVVDLLDSLGKQEAFVDAFTSDRSVLFEKIFTRGSLMGRSPADDVWEIAKSHPRIVHLQYDELFALSRIYSQQAVTYQSVPDIIAMLLSPDFNEAARARQNLNSFQQQLRDVYGREVQLMDYMAAAEVILDLEAIGK